MIDLGICNPFYCLSVSYKLLHRKKKVFFLDMAMGEVSWFPLVFRFGYFAGSHHHFLYNYSVDRNKVNTVSIVKPFCGF